MKITNYGNNEIEKLSNNNDLIADRIIKAITKNTFMDQTIQDRIARDLNYLDSKRLKQIKFSSQDLLLMILIEKVLNNL